MTKLDFEKPILELEEKIDALRRTGATNGEGGLIAAEIRRMEEKIARLLKQSYGKLTPQQKVQVARHQDRPRFKDYIQGLITEFTPLAGDRLYSEDYALPGGMGRFRGRPCVILGQEKGSDTESRLHHNFGMVRPEGYRKAQRLMRLAEKFRLPVITLVDTAGAYPGVGAEERGQAEAIAKSIETCLQINAPIVSVIIGEGGSGGAIAIAAADKVYMLEHSVYSVISPEGCASILWRSADHAGDAATALKMTAQDLEGLGLIDDIIPEPTGGAHRDKDATTESVGGQIEKALNDLIPWEAGKLSTARREKFLKMGQA